MTTTATPPLALDPWQTRRRMAVFLLGLGLILLGCAWRLHTSLQDEYQARQDDRASAYLGAALAEHPTFVDLDDAEHPSEGGVVFLLVAGGALMAAGGLMAIVAPPRAAL